MNMQAVAPLSLALGLTACAPNPQICRRRIAARVPGVRAVIDEMELLSGG